MIKSIQDNQEEVYKIINNYLKANPGKTKFFAEELKPLKSPQFQNLEYVSRGEQGEILGYFAFVYDLANELVVNFDLVAIKANKTFVQDFFDLTDIIIDIYKRLVIYIPLDSPSMRMSRRVFKNRNFELVGTLKGYKKIGSSRYDVEIWQRREE